MNISIEMTELHKAARAFAEAGIAVFPCEVNGKRPACPNGFHDATTDLKQIDDWWNEADYNLAICPGQHYLWVVDVDPGADISSLMLPHTYTVETPRGGKHFYYEGTGPTTASKLVPHVDTRGEGGYVLVPPSVINGKLYRALNQEPYAPVPQSIIQKLASKTQERREAPSNIELDTEVNISRAQSFLSNAKGAVEGEGSDEQTYQIICQVRDLGISEDKAQELIWEYWVPRCDGEWTEDFINIKVANVYRYAQNEIGSDAIQSAQEVFGEAIDKLNMQLGAGNSYLNPISLKQLLARTPPPIVELIPGIIEKGITTFLAAPGGSHKSRLAWQLGLCLGTGTKVFGRDVVPATFVSLSYEDHADEVTRRCHAITKKLALPNDGKIQYMDLTLSAPALVIGGLHLSRIQVVFS